MGNVPFFFPCRTCKEPRVTIAGISCFECRMMASSFKQEDRRSGWGLYVTICALLAVGISAVLMLAPYVPIGR